MNRIDQLFKEKRQRILSIYLTAGYPKLDDTLSIVRALQESGADMVEIGMPFSDPLADGPVIQKSSQVALENGMTLRYLFSQLKDLRSTIHIPIVLMGYLNPVMQFGFREFVEECRKAEIDGLIIPDLPLHIYESEYQKIIEESGLKFIMLITPQTSQDRIIRISEISGGFIYMVADSSTTGARNQLSELQIEYFNRIGAMQLKIPRLIGFGISSADTFYKASEYANGAIIGSAFISSLGNAGDVPVEKKARDFVNSILQKTKD